MPTRDERLRHVTLKIKRAKEHVEDLDRETRAFLDTQPYKVAIKRNPETRQLIYYVASVDNTPDCLPLVAGDAIQNLMSALDHLAYQMVSCDTGDNAPNARWIYFPIADTSDKYEAKKEGKMKGAKPETYQALDALKPYKGGNDLLWMLYRLNNVEKHRLLITVGSMFQSMNIGSWMARLMADTIAKHPASSLFGKELPVVDAYLTPDDVLFPLKAGDELFIDDPDAEPNQNLEFRFNVALYEPQIVEAQSILETVHQLTNMVEGIVAALTPRLN